MLKAVTEPAELRWYGPSALRIQAPEDSCDLRARLHETRKGVCSVFDVRADNGVDSRRQGEKRFEQIPRHEPYQSSLLGGRLVGDHATDHECQTGVAVAAGCFLTCTLWNEMLLRYSCLICAAFEVHSGRLCDHEP
jgi:hypothetical protein